MIASHTPSVFEANSHREIPQVFHLLYRDDRGIGNWNYGPAGPPAGSGIKDSFLRLRSNPYNLGLNAPQFCKKPKCHNFARDSTHWRSNTTACPGGFRRQTGTSANIPTKIGESFPKNQSIAASKVEIIHRGKEKAEISLAMDHYVQKRKGTPQERSRNLASQDRISLSLDLRQAASAKSKRSDDKNKRKPRSIQKFSKSTEVEYPPDLIDKMSKALVLFLQQCGQKAMDSKIVYGVLRAVLIEYQKQNKHETVIEYCVEEKGKRRPCYFQLEFQRVVEHYMIKTDPTGKVGQGRCWTAIPEKNIVSNEQYRQGRAEFSQRNKLLHPDFVKKIVKQAFDPSVRPKCLRPTPSDILAADESRPPKKRKLSECAKTNYKGKNEAWKEYNKHGIDLLSYD